MDIMVYVLLAYTVVLGGMYGWRQYTARQRDVAVKELAGLKALGKYQEDTSVKIDKHNDKLKEELDEKFNNAIDDINADRVSNASSPRNLSISIVQNPCKHEIQKLCRRITEFGFIFDECHCLYPPVLCSAPDPPPA